MKSWLELRILNYIDGVQRRRALFESIQEDPSLWDDVVMPELTQDDTAEAIKFFINFFCYTYDPRMAEIGYPTTIPFTLTPKQEEYIDFLQWHYENGENGATEKSRGEGMSFCWVYFSQYHWLFTKGFKAGFGTYKQEKLDQLGNMDSLFEKFRFSLYRMDPRLVPDGFSSNRHDNHKRIYNPDMQTAITGEVGKNIGRGGRNSIYFVDEHAHIPHAEQVDRSLADNTNCIQYGSTPHGSGNRFYQKTHTYDREHVFTFHWSENPLKNEDWYEDRKKRYDEVTLAQEVDIDYSASVEGIAIPARWVRVAVDLNMHEDSNLRQAGVDVGGGSKKGESVYIERLGHRVVDLDAEKGIEPTDWALKCANRARDHRILTFKYDAIGVGAGIQGTISKMDPKPKFQTVPIVSGDTPTKKKYDDNKELTAKERFANLRAEIWWSLRERFRKTYERVEKGKDHPVDECISIPNDQELITQLSQPTIEYTSTGKVKIESKEDMKERGVKSPDRADALVYAFADMKPKLVQVPAGSK